MKLPKKLKIGGHTWAVLYPYTFIDADNLEAQCEPNKLELRIRNNGQAESCVWVSLFHEVLHAIDKCAGYKILERLEQDERTDGYVDALAEGLYQVLNDNNLLKKPK